MKAYIGTFAILGLFLVNPFVFPQDTLKSNPNGSLTLEEVVKWVQEKQPDDVIMSRIRRNGKPFDLNAQETAELKRLGVTDNVLKLLLDPSVPIALPIQPAAAAPTSNAVAPPPKPNKPASDPLALKVPPEVGIYSMENPDKPIQLELKPVVPSKQQGKIGTLLTGGLFKGQTLGSIAGSRAKARLPVGLKTLYARLGEKTPVEDLVLVMMTREEGRRDLNFGPKAAKPAFPIAVVRQFESKDVGQGVVAFFLPNLAVGDYLFFILGSGEEKKGTLGKGWEFCVE